METKICKRCKVEKSIDEFYVHKMMGNGRLSFCKECVKTRIKDHRANNLERIQRYDRIRYQNDEHRELVRINASKISDEVKARRKEVARERSKKNAHKTRARGMVARALYSGKLIKPLSCEDCGRVEKLEGHHEDYYKPLDVVWLCELCHGKRHWKD